MFEIICTDNNKCYTVYSINYRNGFADFLIYDNNGWKWISDLHCKPVVKNKKSRQWFKKKR